MAPARNLGERVTCARRYLKKKPLKHDQDHPRHARWIRQCLSLAARGQSRVSPNPRVGAIVVGESDTVLGQGWHQRFGGDHAEPVALREARQKHGASAVRRATLYVNLEPCNHHGRTPPCTHTILEYGIPRVVAGMADPNPKASGGIETLRLCGVEVAAGVLAKECRRFNEPFIHSLSSTRPLVTLKVAQTLDGRIATATGDSRWITGPEARRLVHAWRANADGVLVGSGTALADNPALTVRHVQGPNPMRFVLDRRGTLPAGLKLFSDGGLTTAVVGPAADPPYIRQLRRHGGAVLRVPERNKHLDLAAMLEKMTIQSLLVEAGPHLAGALLQQELVDRLFIFIAPKVLGSGIPSVDGLATETLDDAMTFKEHCWEQIGDDMLLRGYLRTLS